MDYIITHSPSASVIALLGHGLYEQDVLTRYLEDIRSKVEYKKHFCGHMHVDKAVNEKTLFCMSRSSGLLDKFVIYAIILTCKNKG